MKKLFYEDSHKTTFSARVTGCREAEKGFLITLDATAFYPEGGGQACDLGALGCARVLDVQEKEGEIFHLCDKALPVGLLVEGRIDWKRRFDLMQQHTGEHILSGIIHDRYGYANSGFHIGAEVLEVDFDGPIPAEDLPELEWAVNKAIWENVPVKCYVPSPEELPAVPYRTKRALPWPVRIVEVKNYDLCACCGIHTKHTGEVGLVKLLSCVKFHQGVRIEMVCGSRALKLMSAIYDQNRQVSAAFSARPLETGEAARHMNEVLSQEKYRTVATQKKYFSLLAEKFRNTGLAVCFEEDLAPAGVRELSSTIAEVCGGVAAVFSGQDGTGYSLCLAGEATQVKAIGTALSANLSARGGGKPGFYQGNAQANKAEILSFFENYLG
ncbi:MAG: alanyl-tRNA editing protein [Ruminococcaceae bacterium]|nr:alanyl-tRNA editing protein [Oscillospiraceae bacterium]